MDNYNAHLIIELIEDVIPKLSRNKTEDNNNGLKVESKKNCKKLTLVESQSPKEIKKFKGSEFKLIERHIEEGQLKNARAYLNLLLKNNKDVNKADFGLKDFQYDQKSEVILTEIKDQKENVGLLKDLAKYYTYITSKEFYDNQKRICN